MQGFPYGKEIQRRRRMHMMIEAVTLKLCDTGGRLGEKNRQWIELEIAILRRPNCDENQGNQLSVRGFAVWPIMVSVDLSLMARFDFLGGRTEMNYWCKRLIGEIEREHGFDRIGEEERMPWHDGGVCVSKCELSSYLKYLKFYLKYLASVGLRDSHQSEYVVRHVSGGLMPRFLISSPLLTVPAAISSSYLKTTG